ncbi:hypothetical protein ABT160_21235 [Streptomyces sp. NPDC001941]|uniref:hypothetical protein n=1 Tax=Streptomyces sp. NPDC001941 TaxID=3154659 RepID=UPI00332AE74F
MTVSEWREWWQRLRTARPVTVGDADASSGPDQPDGVEDTTLKAYAMQSPDWTDALIRIETARRDGEIRLLKVRLLLGTACGSLLFLCLALAVHTASTLRVGLGGGPVWTAAAGVTGAALTSVAAARVGRALGARLDQAPPGSPAATDSASRPATGPGPGPANAP